MSKDSLVVLSVDDDLFNLKLISSLLKKNPNISKIIEASNGLDAIEALEANPDIGCILLDIKMPVMDGIEFLDALSAYPHFSSTPIIILTTDESRKREALDKGAYDFLLKPIRENELNQKIDRVLELYP